MTPAALDGVALLALFAAWLGYPRLLHVLGRRRASINHLMLQVRVAWMRRMLERDPRITDAALIGHVVHSVAFFASATILVTGLVLGALANADRIAEITAPIALSGPMTGLSVRLLLGAQGTILVAAFLSFTWSLRQFNYAVALIGAAPPVPVDADSATRIAASIGHVLSLASASFNTGLRGYYFALAGLAWFVHPLLVPPATVAVLAILLRRQLHSPVRSSIADGLGILGDVPATSPGRYTPL